MALVLAAGGSVLIFSCVYAFQSPTKAVYNARHWTVESEEEPPPPFFSRSHTASVRTRGRQRGSFCFNCTSENVSRWFTQTFLRPRRRLSRQGAPARSLPNPRRTMGSSRLRLLLLRLQSVSPFPQIHTRTLSRHSSVTENTKR